MACMNLSVVKHGMILSIAAFLAVVTISQPAKAAFHLWNISEIYTNSTGTLQFIELSTTFSSQQFVAGQAIQSKNLANTITNTFNVPSSPSLDSANRTLLFGTAGIQAAGGPAPDFIIPNGFLFSAGGTITFFGANSGPYTALPIDGILSRTWGGGNGTNSPKNYAGQTGQVTPSPATFALISAGGLFTFGRRKRASVA